MNLIIMYAHRTFQKLERMKFLISEKIILRKTNSIIVHKRIYLRITVRIGKFFCGISCLNAHCLLKAVKLPDREIPC